MARMCHSLKVTSKEDPRWPEVPKIKCRLPRITRIGSLQSIIIRDELWNVYQAGRFGGGHLGQDQLARIIQSKAKEEILVRKVGFEPCPLTESSQVNHSTFRYFL